MHSLHVPLTTILHSHGYVVEGVVVHKVIIAVTSQKDSVPGAVEHVVGDVAVFGTFMVYSIGDDVVDQVVWGREQCAGGSSYVLSVQE